MRIAQAARLAGTTTKAARFYEARGLLPAPARGPNGYRDYSPADAERLRLLAGLRSLGVPPGPAAELAVLCAAGHCERVSTELSDLVEGQRADIRQRVAALKHLDRRLATVQRHLVAGELPQRVIHPERSKDMAVCDCTCGQCCGCSACGCGCPCASHGRRLRRRA